MTQNKIFDSFFIFEFNKTEEETQSYTQFLEQIEIKYQFPFEKSTEEIEKIKPFCFPYLSIQKTEKGEPYFFVLTNQNREFTYVFCKLNILPGNRYQCLVLASFQPLFTFILDNIFVVIETWHKAAEKSLGWLLTLFQNYPIPEQGETIQAVLPFSVGLSEAKIPLMRSNDLLGDYHLDALINVLDARLIVLIFASLLLEKKIIFTSSSLERLSKCIQACIGLLDPFTWQHIYIPILPESHISTVSAPVPFCVGIPKQIIHLLENDSIDEVVRVDLDNNEMELEASIVDSLPRNHFTTLFNKMKQIQEKFRKKKSLDNEEVAMSFLTFFRRIFKACDNFFILKENRFDFDFEQFRLFHPKKTHNFLDLFHDSQMFQYWIERKSAQKAKQIEEFSTNSLQSAFLLNSLPTKPKRHTDFGFQKTKIENANQNPQNGKEDEFQSNIDLRNLLFSEFESRRLGKDTLKIRPEKIITTENSQKIESKSETKDSNLQKIQIFPLTENSKSYSNLQQKNEAKKPVIDQPDFLFTPKRERFLEKIRHVSRRNSKNTRNQTD
ncbi:denn domain-containing [Anaeramoeba ignava]|uniref:Denn domain-containing n=1 Tax=Anaeramoeba ignava TaxID=1746090 RepID=A0A9Q0L830_ANAIG|nr:denn domain-containing [Anaeramoeba ignava]